MPIPMKSKSLPRETLPDVTVGGIGDVRPARSQRANARTEQRRSLRCLLRHRRRYHRHLQGSMAAAAAVAVVANMRHGTAADRKIVAMARVRENAKPAKACAVRRMVADQGADHLHTKAAAHQSQEGIVTIVVVRPAKVPNPLLVLRTRLRSIDSLNDANTAVSELTMYKVAHLPLHVKRRLRLNEHKIRIALFSDMALVPLYIALPLMHYNGAIDVQ